MAIDLAYISVFLRTPGVEGPQQTRAYVPASPRNYTGQANPQHYTAIASSGVTLATGCDLGQTDVPTLLRYGLPEPLTNCLRPYIGLRQAAAIAKLHTLPLTVAPAVADHIDCCVHAGYLRLYVAPAYHRQSPVLLDDLPRQAQAVIFSVCYQKGCGGVCRDWPKLWGYLTRQDWAAASRELRTGFRLYATRRRIEGELLQEIC